MCWLYFFLSIPWTDLGVQTAETSVLSYSETSHIIVVASSSQEENDRTVNSTVAIKSNFFLSFIISCCLMLFSENPSSL